MADILFYNGIFLTPDKLCNEKIGKCLYNGTAIRYEKSLKKVNAIAVSKGNIIDIGTYDELKKYIDKTTECINLEDQTVIPGFFDAHIHIWKVGDLLNKNLDVRGVKSKKELLLKLKMFAAKNPSLPWIKARGFNEALFEDKQLPKASDLDSIISDRPVFLQRTCAHIAVVNTTAIDTCAITNTTNNVYGGIIDKDTNGNPTGILYETAMGLVTKHFPKISSQDYEEMILDACNELLKQGITCATDPAVHPELLEVYLDLDRKKKLPIRVCAIPILLPDGGDKPYPMPQKYISEFLRVDTVKFFSDGGLSGKTAALHKTYKNDLTSGILRLDFETFYKLAKEAQDAGFQIATHAIGDRAIDLVLDVYEKIYDPKFRIGHRIEHFGIVTKEHLERVKKIGIHIVSQPVFLKELGENFINYLDDEQIENCYPYQSILDAGINLSFSTDAPVVKNTSPLSCIIDAVERKNNAGIILSPKERITVAKAIYCYTQGSAKASDMETFYGSIAIGQKADLVVLSNNPLEIKASEVLNTKVKQVWVDAKKVHVESNFSLAND